MALRRPALVTGLRHKDEELLESCCFSPQLLKLSVNTLKLKLCLHQGSISCIDGGDSRVVDKTVTLGSEHLQNCRSVGCLRSVGGSVSIKSVQGTGVNQRQVRGQPRVADADGERRLAGRQRSSECLRLYGESLNWTSGLRCAVGDFWSIF
ncbi:optineurin [Sarotherodon galilaeus]